MKFYDQILTRSFEITQSTPREVKVLVSEMFQYPSLVSDQYGKVLRIPKPIKKKEGYVINGIIFANDKLGHTLLMKTLVSSVDHLSVHSLISDFSIYYPWFTGKDPKLATFVIDLIEDLCVKVYLQTKLRGLLQDLALANAVSYSVITPVEKAVTKQFLMQSALLSYLIAGRYRYLLPRTIKNDVLTILTALRNFEEFLLKKQAKENSNFWTEVNVKQIKLELADAIYQCLVKFGSPKEIVFLPYTDAHEGLRVNEEVTLEIGESLDAVASTFRQLGLELTDYKSVVALLEDTFHKEAYNLLYDLMMDHKWKEKLAARYMKIASHTEFDDLIFPQEDFAEYARSYTRYAGMIRKIVEQVRSLKNAPDATPNQEVGEVDIAEVIQAMASEKSGNDFFIRDHNRYKNEAWGILLDVSSSLKKPFSTTARAIALCLAEIAKELITDRRSWGLYGFSNKFIIVKDIGEDYGANVKARIGGIQEGGLSYIPDAIELTSKIIASAGKDNNFLFVISDGLSAGYSDIENKLGKICKSVENGGITIISIGVGTDGLKRDKRGISLKAENVHDLLRKFTKMYFTLSAG